VRVESIYLLAGPEQGRRAAFIDELRGSIASADGTGAEEHRLYAQESSVGELLALLRNGALFSTRRLVEYRGAEAVKGKDDMAALVAYIARPAPEAILLLETDSFYLDKALEEAVGKSQKNLLRALRE
jgi:DNA polymerase-3 subunit delta